MINEANLYPCPFCGGKAEYERVGSARQTCQIACTECGCHMETGEVEWSSGMLWNTRWQPISHAKAIRQSGEMVLLGRWTKDENQEDFFEIKQGWFEKGVADRCWYSIDNVPFEPTFFMKMHIPTKKVA